MFTNFLKHTLDRFWRIKRRLRLKNRNFTLFANDCTGGVILHQLGEPFNSPTVNLLFTSSSEYITFLEHITDYLSLPVEFAKKQLLNNQWGGYPVGAIRHPQYGDVTIHFVHYRTFDEARETRNRRSARVHLDNAFALFHLNHWNDTTEDTVRRFERLPFRGKCLIAGEDMLPQDFTWNETLFLVPKSIPHVDGALLERKGCFSQKYIDDFDYISFLNSQKP